MAAKRKESTEQPGREQLLEAVLEQISEAIFTVDRSGRITSWNKGAERLLGYRADQIIGSRCKVIGGTTCLGQSCVDDTLNCPLFSKNGIWSRRCVVRHESGRPMAVLKNGRALRDRQGRLIGGVETMTDVSSLLERGKDGQLKEISSFQDGPGDRPVVCPTSPGDRTMVGDSEAMKQARSLAQQAAATDVSVLITGESGTGKELLAEAIHLGSRWSSAPFVRVDCSVLSESLLESELFGHARGAFTGAVGSRVGRFELAHGGTVFLDEVGDISPSVQRKLLRFLQSREFERVGENVTRKVDVRIVSATNRALKELVAAGSFRDDLYWRLSAFPIELPPLRERMDDVVVLAEHFLSEHWRRNREGAPPPLGERARRVLLNHPWPGNCRELQNVMWYAATVAGERELLPEHFPPYLHAAGVDGRDERQVLLDALERCQWNRSRAANLLGVSRTTLWRRMQRLELEQGQAPSRNHSRSKAGSS